MDSRAAGSIAKPAPPGRRRAPASRNVSSASASNRVESNSPALSSTSVVELVDENAETFNGMTLSDGLGLYSGISADNSMSASSEIPLEEVEKALSGLSREDLVLALKRAKEQMDILDTKLDTYIEQNDSLQSTVADLNSQVNLSEAEVESLQMALQQREERVDELMKEQYKDEDEVYAKTGVIERLRKQLDESEKGRIEAERRYQDQAITSDKERQYYLDMESLLQMQKAKAATAHERILTSNQELSRENERLQHLVSQLRLTSRGFSRSPGPTEDEAVQDFSASTENDSGEDPSQEESLIDEHDISISSRGIRSLQDEAKALEVEALQAELLALQKSQDLLHAQTQQYQTELSQSKAANVELREQNETYMDILQEKTFSGALIEESAVLNRKYNDSDTEESEVDTDDVDDVPDEPRRGQQRGKTRELTTKRSQAILSSLPTSLASELETSDGIEGGRKRERRKDRSEILSDNVEDLHKEIWSLRDANQALTLYVTKILDRIISKEGYENVLAIDGDDKSKMGTLRGTPNRMRGQRSRPTLAIDHNTPVNVKSARRASGGGLLSFMGGGSNEAAASSKEEDQRTPTGAISPSFATRARRTASIDWRSLIGAGSPVSPVQQLEPSKTPSILGGSSSHAPRKISSSEEVEDFNDEEEKEKIRRAMMSHGISLPENQLKSQRRASGFGTFFTRVIGAGATDSTTTTITNKKEEPESIVERGDQHPGPRMTTFDSPPTTRPSLGSHRLSSTRSSSPKSRNEARQRALEIGNSGNLTEVPRKTSPISSRRSTLKRRDDSSASVGDSSRGESVAGDESYIFNSPAMGSEKGSEKEEESDTSWGKAFKRMSMLSAQK